MTKEEHIAHWKITADKDWKAVQHLLKSKDYVHALFFTHLVLEKLCKAHWIKNHVSNHPVRVHNLQYLLENAKVITTEEQKIFLKKMNFFQLEGRYPDYQTDIYKICNKTFTEDIIKQANEIRLWLLKTL